jgi:hypothetical protein
VAAVPRDELQGREALQRDAGQPFRGRRDAGDAGSDVVPHRHGGSGRILVVPPSRAPQLRRAALRQADPDPPCALDVVDVDLVRVPAVNVCRGSPTSGADERMVNDGCGRGVLRSGVWGECADPGQVVGSVADDSPEVDEVLVQVVDGLEPGRWLGEDGEAAGERFDVVVVSGEQRGDALGQGLLAAEVHQRRSDGHRDNPPLLERRSGPRASPADVLVEHCCRCRE